MSTAAWRRWFSSIWCLESLAVPCNGTLQYLVLCYTNVLLYNMIFYACLELELGLGLFGHHLLPFGL